MSNSGLFHDRQTSCPSLAKLPCRYTILSNQTVEVLSFLCAIPASGHRISMVATSGDRCMLNQLFVTIAIHARSAWRHHIPKSISDWMQTAGLVSGPLVKTHIPISCFLQVDWRAHSTHDPPTYSCSTLLNVGGIRASSIAYVRTILWTRCNKLIATSINCSSW